MERQNPTCLGARARRFATPGVAGVLATAVVIALLGLPGCGGSNDDGDQATAPPVTTPSYSAEIRRTTMGVPHIKAADYASLGYGIGYAQATDNLCTIADAMLTYRGERSAFFGPTAIATNDSTIGRPPNLESDFFHRHILTDELIAKVKAAQSAPMVDAVRGFVAGYNRYVQELPGLAAGLHQACRGQPWVRAISEDDIWRRLHQAMFAGGYSVFVTAISSAQPPGAAAASAAASGVQRSATPAGQPAGRLPIKPLPAFGGHAGIGSNMIGLGTAGTGSDTPMLFGNPHWYWKGADRFYQFQASIDGRLNASGVSFLGVPLIQIGFNQQIAWSHTVSTARRFGLYEYTLDPASPTRIMVDGASVALTAHDITVNTLQADGSTRPVTRRMYRSAHGPMFNPAALNDALTWSTTKAYAIRDVNELNFRAFENWLRWGEAASLADVQRIQRELIAVPWVNTVAVGRGAAQAWYADITNAPNVPDAITARCTTPLGQAVREVFTEVPFLDGSQSSCDWQSDADSAQPGSIGRSRLPFQLRDDYVENSNDSYWIINAQAPMTGYPAIMGSTSSPLSLRTRLAHTMIRERLSGSDGNTARTFSADALKAMVLNARIYSAEMLMPDMLSQVCPGATDLQAACAVLAAWDRTGQTRSRGAILWDTFFTRFGSENGDYYQVPFDITDPVNTPRGLKADAVPLLRTALKAAADEMTAAGLALDVAKGDVLYSERQGRRMPLYGGCYQMGYFTIICPFESIAAGKLQVDGQMDGNTYLQVVSFPGQTVEAWTFLTYSQSDDPVSPHYADYTDAYSKQQWLKLPYTESEITADAAYSTTTIQQ